MSDKKMHWYMVSLSVLDYSRGGFPLPYTFFYPLENKLESISMRDINGFTNLGKISVVKMHKEIHIDNIIVNSVNYLGRMTNKEIYNQ
ncbi:hypothetical protein [Acinetobacter sp. neg1]|uniref:hypothetical protein n=1 Tax=Acinetobacter sp. neg1 TaxID=1561068 RepID=UPI0006489A88|nr:hypothetical protein [Acinetobacter sp. neg1]